MPFQSNAQVGRKRHLCLSTIYGNITLSLSTKGTKEPQRRSQIKKTALLTIVYLLAAAVSASAVSRLVPDDYTTIQAAIDAAADGDELTYSWSWTVDSNTYDANGPTPTIELPVGQHTIELIVNDGIDDSEPNSVVITVAGPMEARLWIFPRLINRHSRMRRIMAWLHLPQGVTREQIDRNRPLILYPGEIESMHQFVIERGRPGHRRTSIFAFFDKSDLMQAVPDNGRVELELVGSLTTSQYFYGTDSIWIRAWHWKPWWRRH